MPPILQSKYDTQEEIPTGYGELFEERQGVFVLSKNAIAGIDTEGNVHRLTTANMKIRGEKTELETQVAAYKGVTPEQVLELQHKNEELTASLEAGGGAPNEEKLNTLVELRMKGKLGPLERDLKKAQEELVTANTLTGTLQGTITTGKIQDSVRLAALKANVIPTAVEDILTITKSLFEVLDDGKVVTKDNVGVTPGVDADSYFVEIADKKSHWFPGSQGAGAGGGKGGGSGVNGNNPWTAEFWSLTEQGKLMKEKGREKAELYAKTAGSVIGATRPPVTKK